MNRLKDKRALITGGTSGIGLETARQFLNEGARVALTGTNPATLEAARQELGKRRSGCGLRRRRRSRSGHSREDHRRCLWATRYRVRQRRNRRLAASWTVGRI